MEMNKKYLATVSYTPDKSAAYVRLKVSRPNERLPLSVKATFTGIDRDDLKKGQVVEVRRSSETDHTKYHVVGIIENVGVRSVAPYRTLDAQAEEPTDLLDDGGDEPQDQEHVRFRMARRYFLGNSTRNGMDKETGAKVCANAFGMHVEDVKRIMAANPDGFFVLCRLDQFAHFIIERFTIGNCINGIRDLAPQLLTEERKPETLYDRVQAKFGLARHVVTNVLDFVGVEDMPIHDASTLDVRHRPYYGRKTG